MINARAKPFLTRLLIHPHKTHPKERRNGKTFGRSTGLRRLAFMDELLYANYKRQLTDAELRKVLKAEFDRETNFQPIAKYRYYFNTAHPQHHMGIGRTLHDKEVLPEFGDGPDLVPVGTRVHRPKLNERPTSGARNRPTSKWKKTQRRSATRGVTRFSDESAIEGQKTEVVRLVSKRHRGIRLRKLQEANGICCVCDRDFSKILGGKGVVVLQVHHRDQLGERDMPSVTTLDRLAVVCANCHVMLHLNPKRAKRVEVLRKELRKAANRDLRQARRAGRK